MSKRGFWAVLDSQGRPRLEQGIWSSDSSKEFVLYKRKCDAEAARVHDYRANPDTLRVVKVRVEVVEGE